MQYRVLIVVEERQTSDASWNQIEKGKQILCASKEEAEEARDEAAAYSGAR